MLPRRYDVQSSEDTVIRGCLMNLKLKIPLRDCEVLAVKLMQDTLSSAGDTDTTYDAALTMLEHAQTRCNSSH